MMSEKHLELDGKEAVLRAELKEAIKLKTSADEKLALAQNKAAQFYLDKHGRRRSLNRIILLTPNDGLSQQHLREFEAAGLPAELFKKDGVGLFTGQRIEKRTGFFSLKT